MRVIPRVMACDLPPVRMSHISTTVGVAESMHRHAVCQHANSQRRAYRVVTKRGWHRWEGFDVEVRDDFHRIHPPCLSLRQCQTALHRDTARQVP